MADNVVLNTGSGGDTVAADDVSGVKYQVVKLDVGANGVAAPVSNSNPVPVSDAGSTLSIDDGGGAITVDGSVSIGSALPAGTNAIGKLAANSGVDIGDVDVTSVIPGTGASNLGKAEDAAHSSGDTGVMALAVRSDSDASLSSATGDYTPLQVDANGYLKVNIKAGAGSGGTASADDADFTQNTTNGTPAMGVYESTPTSVTDGDLGIVGITSSRELKVAVTAGGITAATHDSAANADGVQLMGVGSSTAPTAVSANGDATRLWTTTSGALNVADGGGSITVDNGGTFAVQAAGSVAQDAAVSGNPLLMGGRASTATPTAMSADGDVVHAWMTRNGAQVTAVYAQTSGGYTPGKLISAASTNATSIKASAGTLGFLVVLNTNASVRYLKLYNKSSAPTVGTDTPVIVIPIPGDAAGGGVAVPIPTQGIAFSSGIAFALTTGSADSDTGAVGAGDVVVSYGYV